MSFYDLNKHFVIDDGQASPPTGWRVSEHFGWRIARGRDVRMHPIVDRRGDDVGLLLGWIVNDEGLLADGGPIAGPGPSETMFDWAAGLCGRFICLNANRGSANVFLDAGGLLAAVYSAEHRAVASIPTLLPQTSAKGDDEDLVRAFGIPKRMGWYPFGLTPWKRVRRVMPNHVLALDRFEQRRAWPARTADIAPNGSTDPTAIYSEVKGHALNLLKFGDVSAHLTAGYDSRMVLATLWQERERLPFVTVSMPIESAQLDVRVAARLSKSFGFRHEVRPFLEPTEEDLADWHRRAGYCISDHASRMSRTLRSWNPNEVQIAGVCGEIGRAFYWSKSDLDAPKPTPSQLIQRLETRETTATVHGAEKWLEGLPDLPTTTIWDLAYIEQRLGCWAGPAVYGLDQRIPSLSPFNSRRVFAMMLQLDERFRESGRFSKEFIGIADPKLAQTPYNAPLGADRLVFAKLYLKSLAPASAIRLAKRLRKR